MFALFQPKLRSHKTELRHLWLCIASHKGLCDLLPKHRHTDYGVCGMQKQFLMAIFASIMVFSTIAPAIAQLDNRQCDQCGMTVDAIGQARFNIVDANGTKHYACCPICALRLIKTYGELNITSFCDYNGQSYPIIIRAKQYGSIVTVNPSTAIVLLGGGCAKNRLVFNAAAANSLLAPPNNGSSQ